MQSGNYFIQIWYWSGTAGAYKLTASGVSSGGPPHADFTWSPQTPRPGQSIQFTDWSTGSPTSWSWNFGDNGTSNVQNPTHAYQNAGSYNVILTASNSAGSNTSAPKLVTVSAGCTFTFNSYSFTLPGAGGSGSIQVTASDQSCTWTASKPGDGNWLTMNPTTQQTGSATIAFSAPANPSSVNSRSTTITVGNATASVTQAASTPPPCTFTFNSYSFTLAGAGGSDSIQVTASDQSCTWTASKPGDGNWLTMSPTTQQTGSGTIAFSAPANPSSVNSRSTTIMVGNATASVTQAAYPPLSLAWPVSPDNRLALLQGYAEYSDGSLTKFHTGLDISMPAGTFVGAAAAGYVVEIQGNDVACPGSPSCAPHGCEDHGYGNTVIIRHDAGITAYSQYSHMASISSSLIAACGPIDTQRRQRRTCAIPVALSTGTPVGTVGATANGQVSCFGPHLHFEVKSFQTLGTTGDDSGEWGYTSGDPDQSGYIDPLLNLHGATVLNPSLRVGPTSSGVNTRVGPGGAGSTQYRVIGQINTGETYDAIASAGPTTTPSCSGGWYQLQRIDGVNGNRFPDPTEGSTAALRNVWFCRDFMMATPSCSYAIFPTSQSLGSSGGPGSVSVTGTPSGCSGSWTAVSQAGFITITSGSSGSGAGPATVNYSVASNGSTSSRTGTLTVAGQTFTATQSGAGTPARIAKTDNDYFWSQGPIIRYELTATTDSSGQPVTLMETVPVKTTFQRAESTPGWACTPGDYEGSVCMLTLADLGPGGSRKVMFAVRVKDGTDPLFDVFNEVSLTGPHAVSARDCTSFDQYGSVSAWKGCWLLLMESMTGIPSGTCLDSRQTALSLVAAPETVQDDRPDLFLLYSIRDRVFGRTPGGRRLTNLYYAQTANLIAASMSNPSLLSMARSTLLAWQPYLRLLDEGRGSTAVITSQQVSDLVAFLSAMKAAGNSELRQVLEQEETRFDLPSLVGRTMDDLHRQMDRQPCVASDSVLCLNSGRFRVEETWRRRDGVTGAGNAVALTGDSGYFWFFSPNNIEMVVKALNGCGVNGRFWVFAAGLTDVEVTMTVTDTATGEVKTYVNPQGTAFAPLLDTAAFASCSVGAMLSGRSPEEPEPGSGREGSGSAPLPVDYGVACVAGDTALCLDGQRYRVEASWQTAAGASGPGHAVSLTSDSGYFWFFDPNNVEMLVKVLNACGVNGRRWVFAGGLTDVRVELRVTDTQTGEVKIYLNPQKTPFAPIQDTGAFSTCPSSVVGGSLAQPRPPDSRGRSGGFFGAWRRQAARPAAAGAAGLLALGALLLANRARPRRPPAVPGTRERVTSATPRGVESRQEHGVTTTEHGRA